MSIPERDRKKLSLLLDMYGRDAIEAEINSVETDTATELTIVANAGLHPIPAAFTFGQLYIASEGNLDFSSIKSVDKEIDKILKNLKVILKSRRWRKIYLIPFGHSVISMNIKMAVFRTLRIETSDIFYFGEGQYGILEKDTRKIMIL